MNINVYIDIYINIICVFEMSPNSFMNGAKVMKNNEKSTDLSHYQKFCLFPHLLVTKFGIYCNIGF